MAQSEKIYEKIPEAHEIITELAAKYTDELWAVRPDMVTVLGVSNKQRPKGSKKLASIRPIKGATKALMQINNVNTRYLIELFCDDWNDWTRAQRVAVIFHELIHIDHEVGKCVKHDIEDFRIIVNSLGTDWFNNKELPNLLDAKIEFDLNLRPNVPDTDELVLDSGDEILDEVEPKGEEEPKTEKEPEEIVIDDDESPF